MHYKNTHFMTVLMLALPLTTHSMLLRFTKPTKPSFLRPSTIKRSVHYWSHTELDRLRNQITTPKFTLDEIKSTTSRLTKENRGGCDDVNGIIEHIVFKATEHKEHEKKYAVVLSRLRQNGWSKPQCCMSWQLHSAVISNLPNITRELLHHDNKWVHTQDLHGCVPMDYAESNEIKKMLKDAGSRDAQPYTGKDKWYRVPNHGWQRATPLRQAVYNGDVQKYEEIISKHTERDVIKLIADNEPEILRSITDLRFWRTQDGTYLKLKDLIASLHTYHCEEKH
jgi:hypothetical protein